jgi:adenosyl cobinamide kinase/adenosyl cobinamide phosphate guanylyltransferase
MPTDMSDATNAPKRLVLLLGGARAGQSATAQRLAERAERVLFVATAEARDDNMEARIARHRADRPPGWITLEEPRDLAGAIGAYPGEYDVLVLDCLTLWVSNLMLAEADALRETEALLGAYEAGTASWIVVSNEVGLGVVPATELGRAYRDLLGRVNQLVAARADEAYLLVAGRVLALEKL